ncbi:retrovirus-related Pol polyprotein from type-1 retrotransposable element R2 [Nephila pilipes]|uniref:Retrovirus-related Pol polyprotein from type-1 retrotransposable element R2 n=1 Tax=Nephila pilipes TaxID=299642 RepID=A0A8X6Q3J9_NEPPI|nr:retrovirus-related Pol polyprotein from type-1 retrotransposable element R2 [Nephila pilipes]
MHSCLSHHVLFAAVKAEGVDQDFLSITSNMYDGSVTSIPCTSGITDGAPFLRGVKQGCPLSGILFNLSIDDIIRSIQGDNQKPLILAFTDDLVLLAED